MLPLLLFLQLPHSSSSCNPYQTKILRKEKTPCSLLLLFWLLPLLLLLPHSSSSFNPYQTKSYERRKDHARYRCCSGCCRCCCCCCIHHHPLIHNHKILRKEKRPCSLLLLFWLLPLSSLLPRSSSSCNLTYYFRCRKAQERRPKASFSFPDGCRVGHDRPSLLMVVDICNSLQSCRRDKKL